jgi:chemotaxis protein histidine kinase CheA
MKDQESLMGKEKPIEIFMPPNILKAKVGSGGIAASALQRAEQVIEELKEEFEEWIEKDVEQLVRTHEAFEARRTEANLARFYRAAHDLRGQAATFDFPLVARIANSLANLTEEAGSGSSLPTVLVEAHVDAIKVIIRDKIKDPTDATGIELARELEGKTAAYLKKHPAR